MLVLSRILRLHGIEEHMTRRFTLYLFTFSLALAAVSSSAATPVALRQSPSFSTIDFPGSAGTQTWGINPRGDIIGLYTLPDKSTHGFLLAGDRFSPIDYPGAA